jgi:hypothetical protein
MQRIIRVLSAGAGIAIAIWLTGAGPAAAHEGTATTVPAASMPAGGGAGTGELPGVAEYVPPTASPMAAETDRWSALSVMAAATGVLASGAAVAAVAFRRRRGSVPSPGRLQLAGAFALLFAGVAHCALAPSHWAEGWHLGAFFVASGLLLVGQAAVLWLRPSIAAYRSVVLSTAVMIVLYVAARQVALPLVDHRDPYLLTDVPVKVAELLAAGLAVVALVKARPAPARAPVAAGTTLLAGAWRPAKARS